jgi:long-chain fatty acid transport protein
MRLAEQGFSLRWARAAALALLGLLALPRLAAAGGFQLNEMGPKFLGTALAGTAATADDATTGFFNVAGLTRIKYGSVVGTASGVLLNLDVTADSSTTLDGSVPVTGPNGSNQASGGRQVWVPAGHVAQRINEDLVGYLGVTAPFGLVTEYPDTGVTRYIATLSQLTTINVNPGLALSLKRLGIPGLSIGAGFDAQYARAHLNRNVLFGVPPDLLVLVAGEDWAFGWNGGLLYEFDAHTRIGLAYRSQISHNLSGFVEAINSGTGAQVFRGGAKAGATFPDSLTLSGYWEPLPEDLPGFAVLGDFLWTRWSRLQQLNINFSGVPLPNTNQPFLFRDAYRGSIGVQFKASDNVTLRFGSGFDGSPVSDSNRTLQLPDSNRVLLGVGAGYDFGNGVVFDLGYLHLFVPDGRVNQTNTSADHSNFNGSTQSSTDVIGGQFTWNYDQFPPKIPFFGS